MKIEWLKLILKIRDCGTLTEAAEQCNTSQSAASRMIMNVEDELSVKLFSRDIHGKALTFTKVGESILPEIMTIIEAHEAMLSKTSNSRKSLSMAIGNNTLGPSARSKIISAVYDKHPDLQLRVSTGKQTDLINTLLNDAADIIIYSWGYMRNEGPVEPFKGLPVTCVVLGDMPEYLACSKNVLPDKATAAGIHMSDLKDIELIIPYDIKQMANRTSHRYLFLEACRDLGFEPRFRVVENADDIKQLITLKGKANFLSSAPEALREYPGLTYIPITDCPYPIRYYAFYKKNNKNPHIPELIDVIKSFF